MFGNIYTLLEKGLDTANLRQRVIANNIANVNTPGFKRAYVPFEMELRQALGGGVVRLKAKRTHPQHLDFKETNLSKVEGRVVIEDRTIFRNDGNNVDLDSEMAELTKNSIMYEALITRIAGMFRLLKRVIMSK